MNCCSIKRIHTIILEENAKFARKITFLLQHSAINLEYIQYNEIENAHHKQKCSTVAVIIHSNTIPTCGISIFSSFSIFSSHTK